MGILIVEVDYVSPYPYFPPELHHCGRPWETWRASEVLTSDERHMSRRSISAQALIEYCSNCHAWREL